MCGLVQKVILEGIATVPPGKAVGILTTDPALAQLSVDAAGEGGGRAVRRVLSC